MVLWCRNMLFSRDFQKHVKAVEMLIYEMDSAPEAVLSCSDLLLRWAVIRLCDPRANTTCVLKVLDLCNALFIFLDDRGLQLSNYEAACFLPCLVEKIGHNAVRSIILGCGLGWNVKGDHNTMSTRARHPEEIL